MKLEMMGVTGIEVVHPTVRKPFVCSGGGPNLGRCTASLSIEEIIVLGSKTTSTVRQGLSAGISARRTI